jgi:hypothetical protein
MKTLLRTLAASALLGLSAFTGAAEAVTPGRLEFQVLRGGEPSGRHTVDVARAGDGFTVRVSIDLKGQVLLFPFSYAHRCTETWGAGQLVSMRCTDQENGGRTQVITASKAGDALTVAGPGFNGSAPGAAIPTSWWRRDIMRQTRLLDTRTGKMMTVRVRRVGEETVRVGRESIRATRYRLTGSADTDVWYDAEGRWVRMTFSIAGQNFEYQLVTPRTAAPKL